MSLSSIKNTASAGIKNINQLLASPKQIFALSLIAFLLASSTLPAFSQTRTRKISGSSKSSAERSERSERRIERSAKTKVKRNRDGDEIGIPWTGEVGIPRMTDEIMAAQLVARPSQRPAIVPERENEAREERRQDPNARPGAFYPYTREQRNRGSLSRNREDYVAMLAPQPVALNFNAVTGPTETGAFPPDTQGTVGPTQYIAFMNGRLRSFNKTTGAADGVLNVDSDVFFASVMTPVSGGSLNANFTSDPQIRFDRLSNRWILIMIDVPSLNAIGDTANRILIAVSDAASNGTISGSTVWTFYFVQQDTVGGIPSTAQFLDYPSLGVDNNALYIGGDMYVASTSAFQNTSAFVVRKSSILSGGPVVTTAFRNLIGTDGMLEPRGVDNYSSTATEGYFIGVSFAAFSRLNMRRISTPGATPTISADIPISTPLTTTSAISVDHLGNTGGTNGRVDGIDDRLYAAHIRNGRLWTAHSFTTLNTGVASTNATNRRMSVRWYELIVPAGAGTPTVNQSGTIFDSVNTTQATARQYWFPTIMVNGQGHAALGYSTGGTPFRLDAATSGRLASDTLGTTQAVNIYTSSSTAYNPPGDSGPPRRWGDYSSTSLDPLDDMTMWTIQEYCNGTNTYGARVAKLSAPPPPAVLTPSPASTAAGQSSVNIVVTGVSSGGSAFYDPGADLAPPATPFTHISASISPPRSPDALSVNSTTYNSPTQVTVNLNTVGATPGVKTLTITNPDGQTTTTSVTITPAPTAAQVSASGRVINAAGMGIANARVVVVTADGERRLAITNAFGHFQFENLLAGQTYVFSVSAKRFTFSNPSQVIELLDSASNIIFIADN
ncbi:MAG TPA: carboxypeptidase-like regulatory domain-containing protein [Pyrinomonadaceae bacterium]|jgi:hypothetical protein